MGALILTIDCHHPDLLDFIWCKSKSEEVFGKDPFTGYTPNVNYANISVKLTDDFMKAVENNSNWTLIFPEVKFDKYNLEWDGDFEKWISKGYPTVEYRTLKARDILKQISESAWLIGDPGVSYYDTVVNMSPMSFDDKLKPVLFNPCGEQPLPRYGNCLLGALILHRYVKNPYTSDAFFDTELFLEDVRLGIIFLDMIIDINKNNHPLQEQRDMDSYSRRVGQEFTGLADTLAMLNLDYGSQSSIDFIEDIFHKKAIVEIETSAILAKDFGAAPCLATKKSRQSILRAKYIKSLFSKCIRSKHESLETLILEYGLRNSAWNTVGPTGTLSIISDNCTSGIEPLFALEYTRETRFSPGVKNRIFHFPLLKYIGKSIYSLTKDEIKKRYHYKESYEINHIDRINIQSTIQKYIDASISSTINLPEEATIQDIYNIYLDGWKKGLKGLTIFRKGSKKGVLNIEEDENHEIDDEEEVRKKIVNLIQKNKQKLLSPQRSYRMVSKWKNSNVYVNVSYDDKGRPTEMFASLPEEVGLNDNGEQDDALFDERKSYWDSICRLISLLLRAGVDLSQITKQLKKSGRSITDLPSGLCRLLNNFLNTSKEQQEEIKETGTGGDLCPSCNRHGIIYESGCQRCILCGNSTCG